jgi:AP-3 complex subunit sigma
VIAELSQKVTLRKDTFCNFIDDCTSVLPPHKVIYRIYATLVFLFIIDESESELAVLDLIQVLVEVLDKSFENVCELDLIFNPDRLQYIIDEIVVDGMVAETSIGEIVGGLKEMDQACKFNGGGSGKQQPQPSE